MHITQHTLKNKLRVLFVDTKSFPSLTTILLLGVGSRYENAKNSGISHFLEHIPFKGTKNFPNTQIISTVTDGFGGITNAYTSKDHTTYWIKAPAKHFQQASAIIADLVRFPLMDVEEIEREKGVIVEEINMYEDTPSNKVEDIYERLVYDGNPLGRDIIGSKETVTAFDRNTFSSHHDTHYYPNNAVLVVAGGFDQSEEKMLATIESQWGDWKGKDTPSALTFHPDQKKPNKIFFEKKSDQAHVVFGYRSAGKMDEKKHILSVLSTILGGGMSSRLFLQVRERRGLCYYIHTSPSLYLECGTMATACGVPTDAEKINEAIKVIREEHKKLTTDLIDNKELEKVKEMIKGRSILAFEDSRAVAVAYGQQLVLENRLQTLDEFLAKIDSTTSEQVREMAAAIIKDDGENIALVGPNGI